MANIIILFGEMGSGKNYRGEAIAKTHDMTFFDGDTVVSQVPEMLERVLKFQPLPKHILDTYMDALFDAIADQADKYGDIVVGQALYRDEDRQALDLFLSCMGHEIEWYWVKTPFVRNLKQLLTRPKGWQWVYYWLVNKPFFQPPKHRHYILG